MSISRHTPVYRPTHERVDVELEFGDAFVGRLSERDRISAVMRRSDSGVRVILVSGEPGIGKTRLLSWMSAEARVDAITVLWGGASRAAGMPPFLPILEALGDYLRHTDDATILRLIGPDISTLAAVLPHLHSRFSEITELHPMNQDGARLRLFEAVASLVQAIAGTGEMVLVLDDLQWADTATFDLLCHITRTRPHLRLLIAGAYRSTEYGTNPGLQSAEADFNRQRLLTSVAMRPLSATDVDNLAKTYLNAKLDHLSAQRLFAESEGNPFFAQELLRDWVERGRLGRNGSTWSVLGGAEDHVPVSVAQLIGERLRRLPNETIESLHTASVVGRSFSLEIVTSISGQTPSELELTLQPACDAGLLQRPVNGDYSFTHDKIRETLYEAALPSRRLELHFAVGLVCEQASVQDDGHRVENLAYHFARSADRERGVRYARIAGAESLRRLAPAEALQHYRRARSMIDVLDEQYPHLLLSLGEAALFANETREAEEAFTVAASRFRELDQSHGMGQAYSGLGSALLRRDAHVPARIAFERALTVLPVEAVRERIGALVELAALTAVTLGQHHAGMARAREALILAQRSNDPRLEASTGRVVGNLTVRSNDLSAGIEILEASLALAQSVDDCVESAECCASLANAYYWSARISQSRSVTRLREECAKRSRQPYEMRHIHSWLALLAATEGDWDTADHLLEEARSLIADLRSTEPAAFVHQIAGFLLYQQGHYADASFEFAQAIEGFRAHGPDTLLWYLGTLALAQAEAGHQHDARDSIRELESLLGTHSDDSLRSAPALTCLVMTAARLGDVDLAHRYRYRLDAFSGQLHWFLVDGARGDAATLAGEPHAARALYAAGQQTAASSHMQPVLKYLDTAVRRLGDAASSSRIIPAGLSRREVEVLRLLAAGKKNREIADELFLSENTVAKHVAGIFNKAGLENRAAAAAFAVRHGLST